MNAYKKHVLPPTKDVLKINFNTSTNWIHARIFWNRYERDREYFRDAKQCMCHILDYQYEKSDLNKVASKGKNLSEGDLTIIYNVLTEYNYKVDTIESIIRPKQCMWHTLIHWDI